MGRKQTIKSENISKRRMWLLYCSSMHVFCIKKKLWRSILNSVSFVGFQSSNLIQICPFRHSSDKVAKLESQVESYKKKLEDLGDLRRQVKLLEEKNTMYMQNTVSLEEELRKANAARSQLETYKRQVRTGIINAIVLCIVQHFVFITWLIPQSKKKLWKKQLLF